MKAEQIVIVGSGIAGLSCARGLAKAGFDPLVLDKGRGIGGRVATRRGDDGIRFDHGAPFVQATSEAFRYVVSEAIDGGALGAWDGASDSAAYVGIPGMTAFPKYLGHGLRVRQKTPVSRIDRTDRGWVVSVEDGKLNCERLVLTPPAPQIAALLGADDPISNQLHRVRYVPCLTLMAAVSDEAPRLFGKQDVLSAPFGSITLDSSKPGRNGPACWVAHATPAWSADHLELSREDIAALLLPDLLKEIGSTPDRVIHASAHRWRYAQVTEPVGRPFLATEDASLFAGGDWSLGPDIEHAWASGTAIADAIVTDAGIRPA